LQMQLLLIVRCPGKSAQSASNYPKGGVACNYSTMEVLSSRFPCILPPTCTWETDGRPFVPVSYHSQEQVDPTPSVALRSSPSPVWSELPPGCELARMLGP